MKIFSKLFGVALFALTGLSMAACGDGAGSSVPVDVVYVAGDINGTAAYWKDGVLQSLTGLGDYSYAYAYAYAIAVSGSNVYVAGRNDDTAAYWIDGSLQPLTDAVSGSIAEGLAVVR